MLFVPIFLLQIGPGIAVETESPDAHCPDLHRTREAVNARLGTVQGGQGYRARYTIVHARGEVPRDFVLLELSSPDGDVRLRRELPIGESCAAVADAIALVLDQYFRALLAPDDAEAAENDTGRTTTPRAREVDDSAAAPTEAAAPGDASWLAVLETAITSFPPSVALGLRLEALLGRSWHVGFGLAMPLSDRVEALDAGGEARARSFELNAHGGWGPELGSVRPFVGPALFAMLERGYTTSPLMSSTEYRVLAGAGGELGLNVRLGPRWRTVAFASGGRILAQSAEYTVGDDAVLDAEVWLGRAGLGVAYAF